MSKERPVVSSAVRIGVCTLASRITGLVRDMLLVHTFGITWVADAWNYAFQIPNLFRRLFGEGALAAAFVPTFTKTLDKEGKAAAWRQLAGVLALLVVALTAVILLIEGVIGCIWLFSPGDEVRHFILALTGLMLPTMLALCVLALFASTLNSLGSFVPAALTPIVLNIFMIAGLVWVGPAFGGEDPAKQVWGVAFCVLAAGVVQITMLIPVMKSKGVKLGWRWLPRDPAVKMTLALMGPVIVGQGALTLGAYLDSQLCLLLTQSPNSTAAANWLGLTFQYPLKEGALSALMYATRLYQFPLGVMAVSLSTAALPALSRLAAREQWNDWTDELRSAIRIALFIGLIAGTTMFLIPDSIVRMLFEYRNFNPENTPRIGFVLSMYGLGITSVFVQFIVIRAFYTLSDVKTPIKISCGLLPVNLAMSLSLLWIDSIREAAFAISSAITATLTVIVGLLCLRQKATGHIVTKELISAAIRMLLCAAIAGGGMMVARSFYWEWLKANIENVIAGRVIDTCGALAIAVMLYISTAIILRLPEPRMLLRRH